MMSGAVSPIAREIARIVPVKIPGKELGQIRDARSFPNGLRPTHKLACRNELGTARIASCPLMMIERQDQ